MICRCSKRVRGYAPTYHDITGKQTDLWVCAECNKPTRLVFQSMTQSLAPRGATVLLSAHKKQDGTSILRWRANGQTVETLTFYPYPRKVEQVSYDRDSSPLVAMWKLLDAKVYQLMAERAKGNDITAYQFGARGVAESIYLLMGDFYADADAVVREAVARHKAFVRDEQHDTPGLAEELWQPTERWLPPHMKKAQAAAATLSEKQQAFVAKARGKGLSDDEIAGMLKVSAASVAGVA